MEPSPKRAATRSKSNSPTKPQLSPPTMTRIRVIRFNAFMDLGIVIAIASYADLIRNSSRQRTQPPPRIAGLEQMLAFAREQLEKAERDRDAWRAQAEAAQKVLIDARPKLF